MHSFTLIYTGETQGHTRDRRVTQTHDTHALNQRLMCDTNTWHTCIVSCNLAMALCPVKGVGQVGVGQVASVGCGGG